MKRVLVILLLLGFTLGLGLPTAFGDDIFHTMAEIYLSDPQGTPFPDLLRVQLEHSKSKTIPVDRDASVSFIAERVKGYYEGRAKRTVNEMDFSEKEKDFHRDVVHKLLGGANDKLPPQGKRPKILLTAGAPGAGKSTILDLLDKKRIYDKSEYVFYDTDEIRVILPEYIGWRKYPAMRVHAGALSTLTQGALLYIEKMVNEQAQAEGKNIIIDGTMRVPENFPLYIAQAKRSAHHYDIGIVHVHTSPGLAQERVEKRFVKTGRNVSKSFQEIATPQIIERSVSLVKPMVDFYLKVENFDEKDRYHLESCMRSHCTEDNLKHFEDEYQAAEKKEPEAILKILEKGFKCHPKVITHQEERQVGDSEFQKCLSWLAPKESSSKSKGSSIQNSDPSECAQSTLLDHMKKECESSAPSQVLDPR